MKKITWLYRPRKDWCKPAVTVETLVSRMSEMKERVIKQSYVDNITKGYNLALTELQRGLEE